MNSWYYSSDISILDVHLIKTLSYHLHYCLADILIALVLKLMKFSSITSPNLGLFCNSIFNLNKFY